MFKVSFKNCFEIRMGSPYQLCELVLEGDWLPELGDRAWQNKYLLSTDGQILVLSAWDVVLNRPGFKLIILNGHEHTVQETARIAGCCTSLHWSENRVAWKAFPESEGTVEI
jgi:hypothetical protein